MRKIITIIYNLLIGTKHSLAYRTLFFFLFVSPVIILSTIDYYNLDKKIRI